MSPLEAWYAKIGVEDFFGLIDDPDVKNRARRRIEKAKQDRASDIDYPKLAEMVGGQVQIKDQPPLIFHPELSREAGFRSFLDKAIAEYRESLPDDRRVLLDRYRLVDMAMKVVGIGSVGRYCAIGLFMSSSNQHKSSGHLICLNGSTHEKAPLPRGSFMTGHGGRTRARTWDPLIKSQLLYQLSYAPA